MTCDYVDKLVQQESRPCVIHHTLKSKSLKDMLPNYSRVVFRFVFSSLWLNTVQRQYGRMSDKLFLTAWEEVGFYHPEDWPNTLLLGGMQLKTSAHSFFSLQRSAGSTRNYTADSSSWNGIWTSRHKVGSSLRGSGVYGGQDSRALTKPPPDWLDWALHISYNCIEVPHLINVETIENYQSMTGADRVI